MSPTDLGIRLRFGFERKEGEGRSETHLFCWPTSSSVSLVVGFQGVVAAVGIWGKGMSEGKGE